MDRPLIAIVGSTATGKSDLAMRVAEYFNGEIVSADSGVVRMHMDIGTAKPSLDMRRQVPHHLIDVVAPDADFTAVDFKKLANEAIESVYAKGKLPLLVGGTGLYVDSVLYDYSFLPAGNSGQRQELNSMSLEALHGLASANGLDLSSVDKQNKRRVIRLIETNGGIASKSSLRPRTLILGLQANRDVLVRAIESRIKLMIELGLEDEVRQLADRYSWHAEGLKLIGYSEWRLYLEGVQDLDMTKERIIKDTLNLAKRQETWFRRNKSIHWLSAPVDLTDVADFITAFLE